MSKIMVVPTELFIRYKIFKRNILVTGRNAVMLLRNMELEAGSMERADAETNTAWRQPIPYCLVENRKSGAFALMTRQPKQSEDRLHGKRYIGFGGHVEEGETIWDAAQRELREELGYDEYADDFFFQGILLGYDSEVDLVHVGIFCHVITHVDEFSNELDLHSPLWVTDNCLAEYAPNMELWSQLVVGNYIFGR